MKRKARMPQMGRANKYNVAPKSRRWSPIFKAHFDSMAEMNYGHHLYARQQNGEIHSLERQKNVRISEPEGVFHMNTRVDFYYYDNRLDCWVWDEFKGMELGLFRQLKLAWARWGPGLYRVTKASKSRLVPYRQEDIWPLGMGPKGANHA